MAITQHSSTTAQITANSDGTAVAATVPSGANMLVVRLAGIASIPSSVTHNGMALTLRVGASDSNSREVRIYDLPNPTSGSIPVVVSHGTSADYRVVVTPLSGVDLTDPRGTAVINDGWGANRSANVTTVVGDLVLDILNTGEAAPTAGAGQVEQYTGASIGVDYCGASSEAATTTTTTMSWTHSAGFSVLVAIPYHAAAESGYTPTPFTYRNGGILAGSTGVTTYAYLQTTAGVASTGLAFGTSGLAASYTRQGAALVSVTLVAGTPGGTWGAGKFIEVDATNCPGLYRIDWPDAAFAAGAAESVTLSIKGTGLRPTHDQQPLQLDQSIWGGEAITGATQTSVPTAGLPTLGTGQLNRRLLQFLSGPCAGQRVLIVGQTSGNVLQVAPPLTAAPSDGDGMVVL